jgi:biofilm PGA synthesis N-glycosyltransferase PgaC
MIAEEDRAKEYVVVTPVRNEARVMEKTIHSMVQQTVKPVEWVIVNDGSTDETGEIAARYAKVHSWIKLVDSEDRGIRQRGKGIVEAFYTGYRTLTSQDYEFIVKLDGDLSFESTYFEALLCEFAARPKLGIAGGGVYERLDGHKWVQQTARDHVRGPTKMYRRACFEAIGGLIPALGWDGADEWKARALGWEVSSFIELRVLHHRPTGAGTGLLKSRIEQGYGAYAMGYHPLFVIARGVRHMLSRPCLIGGIAMIVAYFVAWLQGREQLLDSSVIRYVRQTQVRQLVNLLAGQPVHEW